jgi:hypothetical protein
MEAGMRLVDALETNRTASILIGGLVVLSFVAFASMLFRHANQVRAATETLIAEEIAQENRTFCGSFGIGPETARHAACVKGLMEIRKRHQERIASDMLGVL